MPSPHIVHIRIYYEDTDSGGVVYYANYLKFAERARTELLRSLGFENRALAEDEGVAFMVRRVEADYLKSARLDDLLTVRSVVTALKNTHVMMRQEMFREETLLFSVHVTLVCVELESGKPVRFPAGVREGFLKFMQEDGRDGSANDGSAG